MNRLYSLSKVVKTYFLKFIVSNIHMAAVANVWVKAYFKPSRRRLVFEQISKYTNG